jgi:hypothetical protein
MKKSQRTEKKAVNQKSSEAESSNHMKNPTRMKMAM